MSDLSNPSEYIDEGSWLYLVAPPHDEDLADAVAGLCRSVGWGVYRPAGRAADRRQRLHALRHADAVIADLSADDAETVADLTAARSAGRPILALQWTNLPEPSPVRDLLEGYERAVVLACSEPHECLRRTSETLSAASWRELVRDALATPDG